jgi:hypothetical protein
MTLESLWLHFALGGALVEELFPELVVLSVDGFVLREGVGRLIAEAVGLRGKRRVFGLRWRGHGFGFLALIFRRGQSPISLAGSLREGSQTLQRAAKELKKGEKRIFAKC